MLKKYFRNSDAAIREDLYDMYILQNIPRIPRPSPEALKTVLDQMAEPSGSRIFVRSNLSTPAFFRNSKKKDFFSDCGNENRCKRLALTSCVDPYAPGSV